MTFQKGVYLQFRTLTKTAKNLFSHIFLIRTWAQAKKHHQTSWSYPAQLKASIRATEVINTSVKQQNTDPSIFWIENGGQEPSGWCFSAH